jgi:hypothetical protein
MAVVIPVIGIVSSIMYCHSVGAVFSIGYSQHCADPAKNATCHATHNSTYNTADGSKYLVPGARTNIDTLAGARCDTLSVRGGCYGSNGNHPNDNSQMRLHV